MRNRGLLYVGLLLMLSGSVFSAIELASRLLRLVGIPLGWHNLWPLLLLLVGVAFWLPLLVWWDRRSELGGLAVSASLFTVNGFILLYTAITRRWGAWSYLWTLQPVALGLSFLVLYHLSGQPKPLAVVGAAFVGAGAFLFLVFASAYGGLVGIIGPLLLIAIGLALLMRGRLHRGDA